MIYAGLFNFHRASFQEEKLLKTVDSVIQDSPSILRKDALILCYGKVSMIQDMDDVWENDSSILIGRAFDKEYSGELKKEKFRALSHLGMEAILKKIWGKYVYINLNKIDSFFEVVLDSTGQLPFFYYLFPNGNVLFSSDIEIVFKILSKRSSLIQSAYCL